MRPKLSKRKVIIGCLVLFVGIPLFILIKGEISYHKKLLKCPTLNTEKYAGPDFEFYDCYDNIAIEISYVSDKHFRLYDIKHQYPVIGFKTFDFYQLVGDTMYVFSIPKEGGSYDVDENGKKRYFKSAFVDGEKQFFYYDNADQMPRYFAIDTITGNVRFYRELSEVPRDEQSIFKDIETRVAKNGGA